MGPKWGSRSAQGSGSAPPTPLEGSPGTRRLGHPSSRAQPRPARPHPPFLSPSLPPLVGSRRREEGRRPACVAGAPAGLGLPSREAGSAPRRRRLRSQAPSSFRDRPLCSQPHAPGRSDAAAPACRQRCPRGSRSQRPGPCTPFAPLAHPAAAMPSAKQRGSKGGHGAASPSDKGAHPSGGADDVAKKPPPAPQQPPAPHPPQQHPQNQAHRGGHRGRSSAASSTAAAAASSASCSRKLGRLLNFLFYLALVAAAAFSGWYVHHVLEEVQQVRRGHQDFSRERDELGQSLQGVEQKVGTPALAGSGPHSCPP